MSVVIYYYGYSDLLRIGDDLSIFLPLEKVKNIIKIVLVDGLTISPVSYTIYSLPTLGVAILQLLRDDIKKEKGIKKEDIKSLMQELISE